eukprot:scaffold123027_cov22-Tisochrysis_lutea.AAC.2
MSSHVRCDVHQHKCFAWGLPTQTDADMVHKSLTWDDLAGHAFYRQWLLHGGRAHGQPLYQAQAGMFLMHMLQSRKGLLDPETSSSAVCVVFLSSLARVGLSSPSRPAFLQHVAQI